MKLGSAKRRKDLVRPSAEELFVVRPDLLHVHLVEAGIDVPLHGFDLPLQIRSAGNLLGDCLFGHQAGGGLEVLRPRQGLAELAR
jgi:hypothetical protein